MVSAVFPWEQSRKIKHQEGRTSHCPTRLSHRPLVQEPSLDLRAQFGIYHKIYNEFSILSQLRVCFEKFQVQVAAETHSYVIFLRRGIHLAKFSKSTKYL